ncbi:MAG TPA: ABC transporter transmembrane domain-containing protein [Longimicrobiales bacterium]|nr:ABC transporter transmembrane domain-containing protein [Longimicrobiales bacterium]
MTDSVSTSEPAEPTSRNPVRALGFLRRLGPRLRPHVGAIAAGTVLILISSAIGLAFPLFVRNLFDAAFLEGNPERLNQIALLLLGLFAIQAVVNFGQSYLTAAVSERVIATLRIDLFDALVAQSPGFYSNRRVGELSSRMASDAGLVQQVLRFGVPELVRQAVFLVGALAIVTYTSPRLTLVTLIAIPFAIGVAWFFGIRVRRISTRIQDTLASAVARAEQVFTQIRIVQSFGRAPYERDRFEVEVEETYQGGLKRAVARAGLTGAVTFSAFAAIVVVFWEGGRLVLAGQLTAGTLIAFLLYAVSIAGAISSVAGFWTNVQEAAGAARRIFEHLDRAPEIRDPESPRELPQPVRGHVRFDGVTFRYGDKLPLVLKGIDLEIRPGENVALVGSSGAGKTTIASLIPRFFDVEDGRVTIEGVDIRDLRLQDLRGAIGIVPQEPMLFAGTIRENLLYGRLDASEEEMIEAAREAHAHEFIAGFPDGYDQAVGERGVTLSGGQRQRMAIARVMLKRPAILILDEASSSLDAESERLVQDALSRLMEDRTTLVIAHRLSTVIEADRIVVLDGGRVVDVGTHADLLDRSEVYSRLYRGQFEAALASVEASGG